MAIFKGGKSRDDHFTGSAKADRFEFDPADLTSGDVIVGGAGRAADTLAFTKAGTVGADALANVSGVERVQLADGTNALTLSDAFVASATDARVTVTGGSGSDRVDASALNGANAVTVDAGAGGDTLLGGAGADVFSFARGTLTAADAVDGGVGDDTIIFGDQKAISADALASVRAVEFLELGDLGTKIALTDELVMSVDTYVHVTGGAGSDDVDVSGVIKDGLQTFLYLNGGAGDDTIHNFGGKSASELHLYSVVDGGAGRDTINMIGAGGASVAYDADDAFAVVSRGKLVLRSGGTIDLSRAGDQSVGDAVIVRGFTSVDASGSKAAVTLTGGVDDALIGGAASDTISGAGYIRGGGGADVLTGSRISSTTFELLAGDFARGETIKAGSASSTDDTLIVTGSLNLRTGTIEGIDQLIVNPANEAMTNIYLSGAQFKTIGNVSGSVDTEHAITIYVQFGRDDLAPTSFSSSLIMLDFQFSGKNDIIGEYSSSVIVHGGGGNDTIGSNAMVYGDDGNDTISGGLEVGVRDGGAGSDTLLLNDYAFEPVRIDLSKSSQGVSGIGAISGFENVDASRLQNGGITVTGSAAANIITGTFEADILSGGDGDDILSGKDSYSGGYDVLNGGKGNDLLLGSGGFSRVELAGAAGADTFRWANRANDFGIDPTDRVTDFRPGEDHLQFLETKFGFSGSAFDTLVVATGVRTDITGADLILYKGGTINGSDDVADYINAAAGGSATGVFVAGLNSNGEILLFHSQSGQEAYDGSISPIANLGDFGRLTDLTLADFSFI